MKASSERPVIGVTGPDHGGSVAWWFSALAIYRAGGRPRRIRPSRPAKTSELDGLILGGGVDLDPLLYGGEEADLTEELAREDPNGKHRLRSRIYLGTIYVLRRLFSLKHRSGKDAPRDSLELALAREAAAAQIPVLGICRGAQMLNAAMGGSLHREIKGFYTETPYIRSILRKKKIHIVQETFLASICPRPTYHVNTLHHQAVDRVAEGLRVCAREENGIVQAIENPSAPFMLGVQWHPEYLPHVAAQQKLFRKLVLSAQKAGRN